MARPSDARGVAAAGCIDHLMSRLQRRRGFRDGQAQSLTLKFELEDAKTSDYLIG
jgi:hypothetical protein